MSDKKPIGLLPCPCGATPVLVERVGLLCKATHKVYKCPSCGFEGEMLWSTDKLCEESWNHTIKLYEMRKSD